MKRLYLSSCLLFAGFLSQAQISKGTVLLGGDINFQTYKDEINSGNVPQTVTTSKQTGFFFQPSVGKAIKDDLVLGFDLDFGYSSTPGQTGSQFNEDGAGIFMRKYKGLGNRFYLFGESDLAFSYTDQQNNFLPGTEPSFTEDKGYSISLTFTPGVAYAVDRKWLVEIDLPSLLYANYSQSKENDLYTGQPGQYQSTKGFDFGSGLSASTLYIAVGLHYMIGGK